MAAMQGQIEEFIATLNRELALRSKPPEAASRQHSLIPVVSCSKPAPAGNTSKKK